MPRGERSNRVTPSADSISCKALVAAGWVMCMISAALCSEPCSSSAVNRAICLKRRRLTIALTVGKAVGGSCGWRASGDSSHPCSWLSPDELSSLDIVGEASYILIQQNTNANASIPNTHKDANNFIETFAKLI